ncbi:MAG TPA: carbohydrate-binding family 9-like protein [Candidatus Limnocylindria bacterium]|jgi:hypothetical protein|nr:carbohydrate-binding family 9-like protein [Candidatus Limnocylindria bacterium]
MLKASPLRSRWITLGFSCLLSAVFGFSSNAVEPTNAVVPAPASVSTNEAAASRFPCPDKLVANYSAMRVSKPLVIDGKLNEPEWKACTWSPRFVDILSGGKTIHDTKAAVLWDDDYLYVGFKIEEPFVHAKFTEHNSPIYYDNDVEMFIAGRDSYYEFEINAFNTSYEVFFIWNDAYEKGGFSQAPEFKKDQVTPFNGVGFTNHPRGGRVGAFKWTFPGKKTAVFVDGTVNKDDDRDRGWTVELALPWKGMEWLAKADERSLPPKNGDIWRMDFSRFNQYKEAAPAADSGGWVWTPHRVWDSHVPECFAKVRFLTNSVRTMRLLPRGQEEPPVRRTAPATNSLPTRKSADGSKAQ